MFVVKCNKAHNHPVSYLFLHFYGYIGIISKYNCWNYVKRHFNVNEIKFSCERNVPKSIAR